MKHTRWTFVVSAILLTLGLPVFAGGAPHHNDQSLQARWGFLILPLTRLRVRNGA